MCDKKKTVNDEDLEAIVSHNSMAADEDKGYKLDWFSVNTSNFTTATCTVSLEKDGEKFEEVALGDGPLDAAFGAINKIVRPSEHIFSDFRIYSISEGKDTLGDATIKLNVDGKSFNGHGLSTDVIQASIVAYINAVNKLLK